MSVNYATADGSATAGQDYTASSGTVTFADNQTTATIAVPITDDTAAEGDETLGVTLAGRHRRRHARHGIGDSDDPAGNEPARPASRRSRRPGRRGETPSRGTVTLRPTSFLPAGVAVRSRRAHGTTVRFSLSTKATVTLTVRRRTAFPAERELSAT